MRRIPLAQLLRGLSGEPFGDWNGVMVTGISLDSRRIAPGELFAALPGTRDHGAAHLAEACARGASAVLIPPGLPPPPGTPGLTVPEPRAALSAVSAAFHGHPSRQLAVLGVTGSNGKTTVTCMLAQILSAGGAPAGYWTTNEVQSGVRCFRPALTTPEAPDLHRFLREVLDAGMRHACMEVSSHSVVQRRIDDVTFRAGVVTTVTPDHLDYHGTFEAYLQAKRGFVRRLPPDALCVHNADDPGACRTAEAAGHARRISVGFSPDADLRIEDAQVWAEGGRCTVRLRHLQDRGRDLVSDARRPPRRVRVRAHDPLDPAHGVTPAPAASGTAAPDSVSAAGAFSGGSPAGSGAALSDPDAAIAARVVAAAAPTASPGSAGATDRPAASAPDLRGPADPARSRGCGSGAAASVVTAASSPDTFTVSLPLPGRHNLVNAVQALAVALDLGVPLGPALAALAAFAPPSRRLRVRRVSGCTVIDDVAMNEASFDAVLGTVAELAPRRLVAVVALRGNRGPEINARIAATLARWNARLDFAPLIATLSHDTLARYALDYRVRPEEARAFTDTARQAGMPVQLHARLEDALAAAVARLGSDGTLLLLGTFGMDEGSALACRLLGAEEEGERFPEPTFG